MSDSLLELIPEGADMSQDELEDDTRDFLPVASELMWPNWWRMKSFWPFRSRRGTKNVVCLVQPMLVSGSIRLPGVGWA
jgi:hypothetical protein